MRRLGFSLLIVLLFAACSGAPQKTAHDPAGLSASTAGAYRTTPPGFPNFVDHSVGREEISIQAMSLVGVPYRWGGNTPDSGFDCSGLVRYVVSRAASVNLPRTTADMSGRGESVEPDEIAPGDLIFFNTTGRPHSHVGIYVGKLRFVNAPSTGGTVRLDYLTNPYWARRFDGIRRVAPPNGRPEPFDTPTWQASTVPGKVAPVAQPVAQPAYAAAPAAAISPSQPSSARVAATGAAPTRLPAASVAATASPPAAQSAAGSPDPFEPPPPGMTDAQMQARAAGAVAPTVVQAGPAGFGSNAVASAQAAAPVTPQAAPGASQAAAGTLPAVRPTTSNAPDPIDAAADAFEPPPPAALAARQAQQAQQTQPARQAGATDEVQIMRASTASRPLPAPTQTGDDPIARFANGGF